jgi:hypothetical protein
MGNEEEETLCRSINGPLSNSMYANKTPGCSNLALRGSCLPLPTHRTLSTLSCCCHNKKQFKQLTYILGSLNCLILLPLPVLPFSLPSPLFLVPPAQLLATTVRQISWAARCTHLLCSEYPFSLCCTSRPDCLATIVPQHLHGDTQTISVSSWIIMCSNGAVSVYSGE